MQLIEVFWIVPQAGQVQLAGSEEFFSSIIPMSGFDSSLRLALGEAWTKGGRITQECPVSML